MKINKVLGIGNALTDMLVNLKNDSPLTQYGLTRGTMTLVDAELQKNIRESVAGLPNTLSLGGSAGNTIRAMARLGATTGMIGMVGKDSTGDFFVQALSNLNIEPIAYQSETASGICLSLVSPDGERTMCTYLGAALELDTTIIDFDRFAGYDCLYVEGYLVQNHSLIEGVMQEAKRRGMRVAIDLASFNIVEENLEFLQRIVAEYVDIIFANEDEARVFTGEQEPLNALQKISEMCELSIVKIGIKGALIKHNNEVLHVGILAAANRVDTTGAGDFYAAGFLAGLCEGLTLRQCGTIGAITAGKVIEVVGTTFGEATWEELLGLAGKVKSEKYLF